MIVNSLLIDNHSKLISDLEVILNQFGKCTVCDRDNITEANKYDVIVLSGGSDFSVTEFPDKYAMEIKLISETTIPVIGICLGCEVIAYTFNSELSRLDEKIVGIKEIIPTTPHLIFKSLITPISVYKSHRWIITNPGPELDSLAKSETGHEIIKVRNKDIWGFQFHPEKTIDQQGDEILVNLLHLLQKE